jgi:cytochrome c-type biogenesis protein
MKNAILLILMITFSCSSQDTTNKPVTVDKPVNGFVPYNPNQGKFNDMIGQKAPDFKTTTLKGDEFRLSDYRGKTVMINFWSLSCAACFKEISDFNRIIVENNDDAFLLISIFDDSKDKVLERIVPNDKFYSMNKAVFGNKDINYEIITDGYDIMLQYDFVKTDAFPLTFFIDKEGLIKDYSHGYLASQEGDGAISNYMYLSSKLRNVMSINK